MAKLDRWKCWEQDQEIKFNLKPGRLVALGKEIGLTDRRVRDTESTLNRLEEQIDGLANDARRVRGRTVIPKQPVRKVLGLGVFVATTEPNGRASLNLPVRALKGSTAEDIGNWPEEAETGLRDLP